MSSIPDRKYLPHAIPRWVNQKSYWFITLCCKPKGLNQLAYTDIFKDIICNLKIQESAQLLELSSIVVMPDHIHIVAKWNHEIGIRKVIGLLKKFISRKYGVNWQRDYFDHRIRNYGYFLEISNYIKLNPVRAGLVKSASDWPFYLFVGRGA